MTQVTSDNQWVAETIPLLKDLPPVLQWAVLMFGAGWVIKQLVNAGILTKKEAEAVVPNYSELPAPEIRALPVSELHIDMMRQYVALYDTLEQMKKIQTTNSEIRERYTSS